VSSRGDPLYAPEHLFDWYGNGDVTVPTTDPNMTLHMSEASARHYREILDDTGAIVVADSRRPTHRAGMS
jgi:hypothetical protein